MTEQTFIDAVTSLRGINHGVGGSTVTETLDTDLDALKTMCAYLSNIAYCMGDSVDDTTLTDESSCFVSMVKSLGKIVKHVS